MKIKVKPEDFIVKEIIDLPFSRKGPYTILKLEKKYWNTLDVIDFIARRLSVSKKLFSRAGLKDRYSLATQYLSFKGNFVHAIQEKNFSLTPIGRSTQPILPHLMRGNEFFITLRSVENKEIDRIVENYPGLLTFGLPNYFDEQRFGSARHRKGFFAKSLMLGHYNGALKLLLCYPYRQDSKSEKEFKNYMLANWGNLQTCSHLAPPFYKRIVTYLIKNPNDHKNAIKVIDRDILNIYLLAYQSYLFNQTLIGVIEKHGVDCVSIPYLVGHLLFYKKLKNDHHTLESLKIPMISESTKLNGFVGEIINSILREEAISINDFALRKMRFRGVRFKSFLRAAFIFPKNFTLGKIEKDEIYKNRIKIKIRFILPPGSYATVLIKRLLI